MVEMINSKIILDRTDIISVKQTGYINVCGVIIKLDDKDLEALNLYGYLNYNIHTKKSIESYLIKIK